MMQDSNQQLMRKVLSIPDEMVGQKEHRRRTAISRNRSSTSTKIKYGSSPGLVNTDTVEMDMPSEEQIEGIKRQLRKVKEIEKSMYEYIQKHKLSDQKMDRWRRDLKKVENAISDMESLLDSDMKSSKQDINFFLINWRNRILDEGDIDMFESIYEEWN